MSADALPLTNCVSLQLREKLPVLVKAVEAAGQTVAWICDPMHGNTESCEGFKTRRYENIRQEVPAGSCLVSALQCARLKSPCACLD